MVKLNYSPHLYAYNTWRYFKSSLLQLHSACRISKRNVCARHVHALHLPFHDAFLSLLFLFHSPSYTLKLPSRDLSWKPVYCHTHASRISSCEQFFYMQIMFVRSRVFSVPPSVEIIRFLSGYTDFLIYLN